MDRSSLTHDCSLFHMRGVQKAGRLRNIMAEVVLVGMRGRASCEFVPEDWAGRPFALTRNEDIRQYWVL
jgi:hypothetical protein